MDNWNKMGKLTTHILDTSSGLPGKNVTIRLYQGDREICNMVTNADGRCDQPLLQGNQMQTGSYCIEFDVADYYRMRGVTLSDPPFLDVVEIRFGIADATAHYHVPLLVSPYGYSTYRGS